MGNVKVAASQMKCTWDIEKNIEKEGSGSSSSSSGEVKKKEDEDERNFAINIFQKAKSDKCLVSQTT